MMAARRGPTPRCSTSRQLLRGLIVGTAGGRLLIRAPSTSNGGRANISVSRRQRWRRADVCAAHDALRGLVGLLVDAAAAGDRRRRPANLRARGLQVPRRGSSWTRAVVREARFRSHPARSHLVTSSARLQSGAAACRPRDARRRPTRRCPSCAAASRRTRGGASRRGRDNCGTDSEKMSRWGTRSPRQHLPVAPPHRDHLDDRGLGARAVPRGAAAAARRGDGPSASAPSGCTWAAGSTCTRSSSCATRCG